MTRAAMLPRRSGLVCLSLAAAMLVMLTTTTTTTTMMDSGSSFPSFVNGFVGHQRQHILLDRKQHNAEGNRNNDPVLLLSSAVRFAGSGGGVALHAEKRYGAKVRRARRENNRQSRRERAERKDASDRNDDKEDTSSSDASGGSNTKNKNNTTRGVVGLLKWPFRKIRSTMRRRSSSSS